MQKTEKSKSCNSTPSAFGHGHEEDEDEDSDVDSDNNSRLGDTYSEDGGRYYSEYFEESREDGDEHNSQWTVTDEDEDGYQDLDTYEADSEDQDAEMDRDEDEHQHINPSEDQDGTSNLKPDKESLEKSPLDDGNLHDHTPALPQASKPDPSPTTEPYYDTIALGQHHIWI